MDGRFPDKFRFWEQEIVSLTLMQLLRLKIEFLSQLPLLLVGQVMLQFSYHPKILLSRVDQSSHGLAWRALRIAPSILLVRLC